MSDAQNIQLNSFVNVVTAMTADDLQYAIEWLSVAAEGSHFAKRRLLYKGIANLLRLYKRKHCPGFSRTDAIERRDAVRRLNAREWQGS